MEEKKNSKAPIIIILVLLFLFAVAGSSLGGYLFGKLDGDKIVKEKTECEKQLKEAQNEAEEISTKAQKENNNNEVKECETEKPRCYGTYISSDNAKWILKEDGTYNVEGQEIFGVYFIKDNTITFITSKHTVGPRDKDPHYTDPHTYLILDDCSTIYFTSSSSHTGAGLTKQD